MLGENEMLTFVWAQDKNGVIGYQGGLPWYLPNDMKFFKETTMNGAVVMGRKTYESIPNPPLPKRDNIVLTKNVNYQAAEGVKVFHSKEEVLSFIKDYSGEVHIIGGAGIFELFKNEVEKLYRTVIDYEFPGDTYMIPINWDKWELIDKQSGIRDEKNQYDHVFETYTKKN